MNKIQNFFRKADTILFQIIWGTLLFLIIYMLLNYSNFPTIIVFLIPCFFMYMIMYIQKITAAKLIILIQILPPTGCFCARKDNLYPS